MTPTEAFQHDGPWRRNCIFLARAGSSAYGTRMPTSDLDVRGVFLPDPEHILGLHTIESHAEATPLDATAFELRHFVRLCLAGSPLPLEMLFYPSDVIEYAGPAWLALLEIRATFLGRHLKRTLGGFAQGDLRRIAGETTRKCGAVGKALIEQYGWNTKHGANAYRLLRMSEHLFRTGALVVRLPESDRAEILKIRSGGYPRDEFLAKMQAYDHEVFALVDTSPLPAGPDHELAEHVVMDLLRERVRA